MNIIMVIGHKHQLNKHQIGYSLIPTTCAHCNLRVLCLVMINTDISTLITTITGKLYKLKVSF